jgi:chemotaxis protein CheD
MRRMDCGIVEVCTGEVKTTTRGTTLIASALGSCIAIIAYDPQKHIGGMSHIMLPGKSEKKDSSNRFRYAEDGINELMRLVSSHGSEISDICFVMAGGANVLKRKNDTICKLNIDSALNILKRKNVSLLAHSLGGVERRRIKFDISNGLVLCSLGDGNEKVLWKDISCLKGKSTF